jgi:hypothetical protein
MNKEASKATIRRTGNGRPFASEPISRRSFIKRSAVLGASSILAGSAVGWMPKLAFAEAKADITAVKGANYFQNTIKAVELLGGMGKFVSKQSKVGLLINFRYAEDGESASALEHAITKLDVSPKFMDRTQQGNLYTMVGREKEFIVVNRFGRYITIVIGQNQDKVRSTSGQLVEKLKSG